MTETARPHAKLGASTSDRWTMCPGSLQMIDTVPVLPAPSSYALEGTAMHRAGEEYLRFGKEPQWDRFDYYNGKEDVSLDQECQEAVQFYVDVVAADLAKYGGKLFVEKQFTLERLRPDMWGTNDALLAYCTDDVLRVYDFKGGRGVAVDVTGNKQLRYYGLGALLNLPKLNVKEVELIIVQPRASHPQGPVRRERMPVLDLYDFSVELIAAAKATDQPGAPLRAGAWCRWCPAAGFCREFKAEAERQMRRDFSGPDIEPFPDPRQIPLDELGDMATRFGVARDWMNFAEQCIHAALESGRPVKGWKLVAKRATRKWMGDIAEVAKLLAKSFGLTNAQMFDAKLRSPAQIEKLLPKAQRERLEPLYEKVSSGSTLAAESDPRPAIAGGNSMDFQTPPLGEQAASATLPPALR